MKNKKTEELSDGDVEEAFFRGFFFTYCECGHYSGEHKNGNGKCKICFCKCNKYKKKELKPEKSNDILFYLRGDNYGCFSNLERSIQVIDKIAYRSNEDYYQIIKARTKEISDWIKKAPNPYLAMVVGHGLREKETKEHWDDIKVDIMFKGLRAKFNQNSELKEKLLATGNAIIHEDSPTDMFWGIKGKDMLGKLLMQVRNEIRGVKIID